MSWKTEIDRLLQEAVRRALDDRRPDGARAIRLVNEYIDLAPSRGPSHFLAGVVEEVLAADAARAPAAPPPSPEGEAAQVERPVLVGSGTGVPARWRWLGRLDAAAHGNDPARVRSLASEPAMDEVLVDGETGRAALYAAGRALLAGGEEPRLYELWLRHLKACPEDASKRAADDMLGDAVRRAEDLPDVDDSGSATTGALARALAFADEAKLEGRAGAKIERKLGRLHQLAGRFDEATRTYRSSLGRLATEDRYRSVLLGDMALASLGVRGTLDLLPVEGRTNVEEAERLLAEAVSGGEGESYNALYTLGILAYERGEFGPAAERFREADRLMRETRAKARIVHARARFFLGASLLRAGAEGEALAEAEACVTREANAANLDPALKEPIFDLLAAAVPEARIPGRGGPARGGHDGRRDGPRDGRRDGGRRDDGRRDDGRRDDGRREAPRDPMDEARREPAPAASGPEGMPEAVREPSREQPRREGGGREGGRDGGRGRRDRGFGGGRGGRRGDRGPDRTVPAGREDRPLPAAHSGGDEESASPAAGHLAAARRALDHDSHVALRAVDEAFKARPTFEEWYAAYRIRLEALIRLEERTEALRTYERFRAKLRERNRPERLEELLLDASGPMSEVLDGTAVRAELVDLYETMPGRERPFVEACVALAREHAASGNPVGLRAAVSLLREAVAKGGDEATALWPEIAARARAAGISVEGPSVEDVRARVGDRAAPRIVVVGGDESDRAHAATLEDLGRRAGFALHFVLGGARPPQRTLEEIEAAARGATALVVLHGATPDVREGVRRVAGALELPVREIPYAGAASLEPEVLTAVSEIL